VIALFLRRRSLILQLLKESAIALFFKKAIADPTITKRKCDRDEKISVLVSITSFKNRI